MALKRLVRTRRIADLSPRDLGDSLESTMDRVGAALGGRRRPWWRWALPSWMARERLVVDEHIREGRFQISLALIAGISSLLSGWEVATEHYRGSYSQRIMYSPLLLSPLLLVAGVAGAVSRRAARTILPFLSLLTVVDGFVGFWFHVRGVHRKPGGWRIPVANVIMGPPVFAPLLFALSGYLGLMAAMLRREGDPPGSVPAAWPRGAGGWLGLVPHVLIAEEQQVREGRFQKQLAAAAAASAVFSGIEALYSHYKNNFNYRVQWTPIILTPALVAAGIGGVFSRRVARTWLPLVSAAAMLDGAIGSLYHLRGVLRRPGGLKLPLHNLMYGPPIFAPLLFAASGFLGLLASLLQRAE